MKKSPYETAADLIARLRKRPSQKSDVVLVREMEEHSYIDIITNLAAIGGLTYYAFDSLKSGIMTFFVSAGILACCFAVIVNFRKAVRARDVRVLFESQGPQFLKDLAASPARRTAQT